MEHNEYLKECLASGKMGRFEPVDPERRAYSERQLQDDEALTFQARYAVLFDRIDAQVAASQNPIEEFRNILSSDLPPIHEYRVNYDVIPKLDWQKLTAAEKQQIRNKIRERRAAIDAALNTGIEDNRKPLDPTRRAMFEASVSSFESETHPETIPTVFSDGACSIFGHICPVFFAAEAHTETSTERRRGRYIAFDVKMRVVRRDNYTCQHCGKHLQDNEVEFDHIIPIAKGGSSEEHNIRLTCFDCNRDKSDNYVP
jgi:HNH endonuclease